MKSRTGNATRCAAGTLTALAASLVITGGAAGQMAPLDQFDVTLHLDSGMVANLSPQRGVIFSTVVAEPGASWLRLDFDQAWLGAIPQGGPPDEHAGLGEIRTGGQPTILRITSLHDGAQQTMNATHLEQWQYTSAYFNGDALLIEIIADPVAEPSRLVLTHAWAGPPAPSPPETICGADDDRVPSYDNRSGRVEPIGCTGWRFDDANRQFMMAGHCSSGGNADLIEFNVPLSDPSGSVNHPGPEDQYAIDPLSHQWQNGGVGDDWAYFGVFRNTNTGLTPYEAYGGYYATSMPPAVGTQDIRITGYGSVSSPVSPTWNYIQKRHDGPYWALVGTEVRYRTDTTGGNSGSAVHNLDTNSAIGIHTHGGCGLAPDSYNKGTGLNHGNLQNALSNPQGVCVPALCQAAGGCDEYIERVQVGTIDNSSSCNRYRDYTAMSTTMVKGQSYSITVTVGNPYSSDQGGVWVDWNQDDDFDDAGEEIAVSGTPGVGPYTATITPPFGAANGNTRLRIRVTYTGAVDPCDVTTYGEVEDYTINVVNPSAGNPYYHCSARVLVTGAPNANTVFLFDNAGVYTAQSYPEAGTALTDSWGYRDGASDRSSHVYFGYGGGVYRHNQDGSAPTLMFDGTNAPGGTWRALAFDPTGDGGNGSFWSASFASDLVEADMAGNILNAFPPDGWSLYGLAYDATDGNLWGHDAAGDVIKIDTNTGTNMGVQWTTGFASLAAQGGLSGHHDGTGDLAAVSQGTPDELGVYDTSGTMVGGPWDMQIQTGSNGHLGVAVNVAAAQPGGAVLYFSEDSTYEGLWTLDMATGAATHVGTSGVGGATNGLAPSDDPSVLFGSQPFDLLRINTDGSGFVTVGGDTAEGYAYDHATGTLYGQLNSVFFLVDPATGNNIGTLAAPGADLEGLAWGNGGVYGIGDTTLLRFYNPGTNAWSTIGDLGQNFDSGGLAYHPGENMLYAVTDNTTFLYRIDPNTAGLTIVGDTGIQHGGGLAIIGSGCENVMWDESVHGDLSDANTAPTPLMLQLGGNCVIGTVGPGAEDDFFKFTVPPGATLQQVVVLSYSSATNSTFLGVNLGPIYEPMSNPDCWGYTFFGMPEVGTDVLPDMGASNGNFTPPLPAGEYSWWVDEGTGPESYTLNFVVGSGPPPCPEDINGDGIVDVLDLLALLAAWGSPGGPADVNGDGIVDVLDLLMVLAAWGPC